jgi:hypothetical protein
LRPSSSKASSSGARAPSLGRTLNQSSVETAELAGTEASLEPIQRARSATVDVVALRLFKRPGGAARPPRPGPQLRVRPGLWGPRRQPAPAPPRRAQPGRRLESLADFREQPLNRSIEGRLIGGMAGRANFRQLGEIVLKRMNNPILQLKLGRTMPGHFNEHDWS